MNITLELQPCCGNRSGIGIYTYELAKRLTNTAELHFAGTVFNFLNRHDNSTCLKSIDYTIKTNFLISYGIYRRIWHYAPVSYDWLFHNQSDICHFFDYIAPQNVSGKVITTIHDMSFFLYPETLNKRNLKRITKDIDYSINRSDIIITVSKNSKEELLKYFHIPEKKVEIVYPSFDSLANRLSFPLLASRFQLSSRYILYVGNLEPRKNISSLIRAYHKLKTTYRLPYQLIIAGQKGWQYESIFETVKKLHLEKDIIFTGYLSAEEKSAFYQHASLFVFPSLYEGFGIPILEAMSASVPVVCSNTSSMPEAAGDAALFTAPKDIDGMANAMLQLLTDENLRKEKIKLGLLQAQKFSWDKSASKLIQIYKSLK